MSDVILPLDALIAEIHAKHHPNPPATQSQIEECETRIGFRLPDDLRQFYRHCNGARIEYRDFVIVAVDDILRARQVVFGDDTDQFAPAAWYGIMDCQDGDRVAADLMTVNGEYCRMIDCDHEDFGIGGSNAVIAYSFTEFLSRHLESLDEPYWLGIKEEPYANALRLRENDPDIIDFVRNSKRIFEEQHEAHWKAIWRAAGKIVD